MPAITFPFNYERHVYLEDWTRASIPRGTPMTVRPTILFEAETRDGEFVIYIPMGDGALDRSSFGDEAPRGELVKLEHLVHDSSAGPLAFTSVMPPQAVWDLAFRSGGHASDFRNEKFISDLFIADVCFHTNSDDCRPILISGHEKYLYQTAIVSEKHLSVCMRIEQYFYPWQGRDSEPSFLVQVPKFRPEVIYGQFDEKPALFFTCSVWDVLLCHHLSNWSEQDNGAIAIKRNGENFPTQPTTPVLLRKATSDVHASHHLSV